MAIPLFNVSSSTPQLKDTYNPVANALSDQERRNKETGDKSVQILRTVQTSKLLKDFREIADPTVKQFNDFYNELSRYNPDLADKERDRFYKKLASDAFAGKKKKSWDEPIPDDINKLEEELKQLESDLYEAESGNSTILNGPTGQGLNKPTEGGDFLKRMGEQNEQNDSINVPFISATDGQPEVSPVTENVVDASADPRIISDVSQRDSMFDQMVGLNLPTLRNLNINQDTQQGQMETYESPSPYGLPMMYKPSDYINLPRELGGTKKQPLNPLPRRI